LCSAHYPTPSANIYLTGKAIYSTYGCLFRGGSHKEAKSIG
jgi:hypothetical protein